MRNHRELILNSPDIPGLAGMRINSEELDNVSFVSLRENAQIAWPNAAKRALDVPGDRL